ncbi:hypothetical protein [Streptomyces sp. NPDC058757]|uniref:hypothetical protein n=1 Tax=Streptomyces sp. NPDC058757 TaxID=3346626 RepID=UPI0036B91136
MTQPVRSEATDGSRRGEHAEAALWYRRSAEGGNPQAMAVLGSLRHEEGAAEEAEGWYRRAAEAGLADAAYALGQLLHQRGEAAEAERWARRAAAGGSTAAMNALGALSLERGDREAATSWYRKSAAAGDEEGRRRLASLLTGSEMLAELEERLTERARQGDPDAFLALGRSRELRGDPYAAQGWYEKAARAGNVGAMIRLAELSERQGLTRQARAGRRKAAEATPRPQEGSGG